MFKRLLSHLMNQPINNNAARDNHAYPITDETFRVDFVSLKGSGDTLKNSTITFPADGKEIVINGEADYFDAYYVNNEGLSSDNAYYRIATPDLKFWIYPNDLKRFMSVLNHRHTVLIEGRKQRNESIRQDVSTPFSYDQITDDIYNCFIANKTGMSDEVGTWGKFNRIEEKISALCQENRGKYYKSQAKSAKFAVIFDPYRRVFSNINSLREKGYKVTNFENALQYFGLAPSWDCKRMAKIEKEFKEEYLNK